MEASIKYIFIHRKQNSFKTKSEKRQSTLPGTHLYHEAKLKTQSEAQKRPEHRNSESTAASTNLKLGGQAPTPILDQSKN